MQSTTPDLRAMIVAPNLEVDFGAELLDASDVLVEDISADLVGGTVSRSNYATIHGACKVDLQRELDWSSARVRLFQTLSAGDRVVSVEVVDRPAAVLSKVETTNAQWNQGVLVDVVASGGSLRLDLL